MSSTDEAKALISPATAEPVNSTRSRGISADCPLHRHQWAYGFWFKNKHMRRLAEKHKRDWQRHCLPLSFKIVDYVIKTSGVCYTLRSATYNGQNALIVTFVEDDDSRRLDGNEFSERQIDRVRRAMGLPKGTKPKWYELSGCLFGEGPEDSDDEEFPMKTIPGA